MHDYDDCWDDDCEECYEEGYDEGHHDAHKSYRSSGRNSTSTHDLEGCYIATAVYGSYDCPKVWVLRRYRDFYLSKTKLGKIFIHAYYAISPTLVKRFGASKLVVNFWKGQLDCIVEKLLSDGVDDSPYEDMDWR